MRLEGEKEEKRRRKGGGKTLYVSYIFDACAILVAHATSHHYQPTPLPHTPTTHPRQSKHDVQTPPHSSLLFSFSPPANWVPSTKQPINTSKQLIY